MEILPIVLDKSFNMQGIIDDYSSLIWAMRYYTNGDFEITTAVTDKNLELLQKDFYIIREDDDNVGIIEHKEISINEDGKEVLIISGGFLPTILSRRIIALQTQLNSTVSKGIERLINENVISPIVSSRKIPGITVKTTSFDTKLEAQYTGQNLLETIEEICTTYHLGIKGYLNDIQEIVYELYAGIDRSYNQTTNPYVIFSDEFDNLLSSCYAQTYSDQITDVLVAGEGEGLERKTLWVNKEIKTGLERYEVYMDRRDLSTNNGEISEADYNMQLKEAGLESITPYIGAFDGTVYFNNNTFRKDVNVGDICVIENKKWGLYINSRLIEVIESIDETGKYTLNPTFGV